MVAVSMDIIDKFPLPRHVIFNLCGHIKISYSAHLSASDVIQVLVAVLSKFLPPPPFPFPTINLLLNANRCLVSLVHTFSNICPHIADNLMHYIVTAMTFCAISSNVCFSCSWWRWKFSTSSHRRGGSVVEPSSDNSTAKRLATGASVTGPLRWPLQTNDPCHSRCGTLKNPHHECRA